MLRRQSFRCPPRCIEAIELPGLGLVHDREQVAADPVIHRGHQTHHRIDRDGRIDGVAAAFKNLRPDLRGQDAFARHDPIGRLYHRARLRAILRERGRCDYRMGDHTNDGECVT